MSETLLVILLLFGFIILSCFLLGIVIPVSCTIGGVISNNVEDFLCNLMKERN